MIRPDGGVEKFLYTTPFGLLTEHQRPNGQQQTLTYDIGQNRPLLQSITDYFPDSKTPLVTYFVQERRLNGSINPADETDFLRYTISPVGRVVELYPTTIGPVKTRREFLSALYPTQSIEIAPSFDEMESWKKLQNLQNSTLTEYSYNPQGLIFQTKQYAALDSSGNGVADSQMAETDQYWNDYGQCIREIKQVERNGIEVIETAQINQDFDGLQRLIREIDPLDNTISSQYDINIDSSYPKAKYLKTVTQPNQRLEKNFYDQQGDLAYLVMTIPKNGTYSQPRITQWIRDIAGRPTRIMNPDGGITYQSFYLNNQLGLSISTTGRVSEYQFDRIHNYECKIDYQNPVDVSQIDITANGDLIKSWIEPSSNDQTNYRFYDASHRLCFEVDAKNQLHETRYNVLDKTIAKIQYAASLTADQLATLKTGVLLTLTPDLTKDRCTSYYYDNDQLKIAEIDPDGWVTEYQLNPSGRIEKIIEYSTPNRESTRSNDFAEMRPIPNEGDGMTYIFRNARGQETVMVNAENFLTATEYYASEKIYQTTIYYNKVVDWKNTTVCPPLPAAHSEDRVVCSQYDLLDREINQYSSNGVGHATEYNNMGKVSLIRDYDERFDDTDSLVDPDKTRIIQKHYDGWDNVIQTANPAISQQLMQIEINDQLSPEEKQQQQEKIWSDNSWRDFYDEVTNLKLATKDTLSRTTIFYYDRERRPVLKISALGAATQFFYNTFNNLITQRQYFSPIPKDDVAQLSGGFITDQVLALLIENSSQDMIETYTYDKLNQKISYQDPEEYLFTYAYNAFLELIEEQQPVSEETPSLIIRHNFNPRGKEISTERSSSSGLLKVTYQYEHFKGKMTNRIDENGAVIQNGYDRLGNLVEVIDELGLQSHQYTVDALKRVLIDLDAEQQPTTYVYNQTLRTKIQYPPLANTQTVIATNVFRQIIKKTDALSAVSIYRHSPFGQVTQSVNELNLIIQDSYDTENQLIFHLDPMQTKTSFNYNQDGYLIQQTQESFGFKTLVTTQQVDTFGRAISVTDPRGVITAKIFNQRGLCIQKIRDVGTASIPGLCLINTAIYNGQRTRTKATDGDEKVLAQYAVDFLQDGFNRAIGKIIDPDSSFQRTLESRDSMIKVDQSLKLQSMIQYDSVGRVVSHTDAAGRKTYLFYDSKGQKRFAIDAQGGMIEWQYNSLGLKSLVCTYCTALTAEELKSVSNATLETIEALASSKHNSQDWVNYFYYDQNRREKFKASLYQLPDQKNPQAIIIQSDYSRVNRLIARTTYANMVNASDIAQWTTNSLQVLINQNASQNDRRIQYIVDNAGQECFTIDARGVVRESRYDNLGRVIGRIRYANFIDPKTVTNFSVQQMSDYLAKNIADPNLDQVKFTVFNLFSKPEYIVKSTLNNHCSVQQFFYDETGNLTGASCYQDPITFNSYQDLLQKLSLLTPNPTTDRITAQKWDNANRIIEMTDALGFKEIFTHDAVDNLTSRTDRAGFLWVNGYDRAKRLITSQTPECPVTTVIQNDDGLTTIEKNRAIKTIHSYDQVNNLTTKTIDSEGDEPRIALNTFVIDNQLQSIIINNVEVDDPAKLASLSSRPVVKKNLINQTVYSSQRKKIVTINEKNSLKFWVYDSLGRLIFLIDSIGKITEYVRNNFNEVIIQSEYADILNIDLSSYAGSGLPINIVIDNLIYSDQDRHTYYDRNLSGDAVSVLTGIQRPSRQGLLFYYYPKAKTFGYHYAQANRQYNAFKQPQLVAKLISPNPETWTQEFRWYDGQNHVIAQAVSVQQSSKNPVSYRVTRTIFSTFNQKIQETIYAVYCDITPASLSLASTR